MQSNTEARIQMNFQAGVVSSSNPPCMPPFFSYAQFDGISVESRMEISTAKAQVISACSCVVKEILQV